MAPGFSRFYFLGWMIYLHQQKGVFHFLVAVFNSLDTIEMFNSKLFFAECLMLASLI